MSLWSKVLVFSITADLLFSAALILRPAETQLLFNLVAFGSTDYPAGIPESAQRYIVLSIASSVR